MKKIVSFGDSFVFGTELQNNHDGSKSWIGQAAKNLGCEYQTCAVPGCGNDHIARQIYSYFSTATTQDTLAVINWTWIPRWDFYIAEHETWITLGTTCVPETLQHLVDKTESQRLVHFYHDYANRSLLWNKFRNLQTIFAAQSYLKSKNIANIQTYMDYHLFDTEYHVPDYVQELQNLIRPNMSEFEGSNFLDWSTKQGFTTTVLLHPLEDAHNAACDFWQGRYAKKLKIDNS